MGEQPIGGRTPPSELFNRASKAFANELPDHDTASKMTKPGVGEIPPLLSSEEERLFGNAAAVAETGESRLAGLSGLGRRFAQTAGRTLRGIEGAADDFGQNIGDMAKGSREGMGNLKEALGSQPVREAISHAVKAVAGRIPNQEFISKVASGTVSRLRDRKFLGQLVGDLVTGMFFGGGMKIVIRTAAVISGVGIAGQALAGIGSGAAGAWIREARHQRRELSTAADDAAKAELKGKFKDSHRMRNAVIRGAVGGLFGATIGLEIFGAILDHGVGSIANNIASGAKDMIGEVLGRAGEAIGGVAGGVGNLAGGAGEVARNVPGVSGVGNLAGGAGEVARNVPGVSGVGNLAGGAGEVVGGVMGGAGKTLGNVLGGQAHEAPLGTTPDLSHADALSGTEGLGTTPDLSHADALSGTEGLGTTPDLSH
ncbi:hypothetical protein KKE78_01945, partial [Patescibacteria group bacterium]|nr:hypothetical protein [Patescibacteria group bacterium]